MIEKCQGRYSEKLIFLVKSMIQENPSKRITLEKLRTKLKSDESEIIREEMLNFKINKE